VTATLTMDGAVARLRLERPEALNALNRAMAHAIESCLKRLEDSPDVTVVIVSGSGRSFCAGADISEMPTLSAAEAEAGAERWQRIVAGFAALPQVTIAAVHGHALGGGCMLAAAQDLRIADASARFGLPEVSLGFPPGWGIARLVDVLGGAHARDLILTGRTIGAEEALRMGLVMRVVPEGALDAAAVELADQVARHPRGGLAAAKAAVAEIRAGRPGGETRSFAALRTDGAAQERIAGFLKRKHTRTS
jgi:enoyl-CoA hydratase